MTTHYSRFFGATTAVFFAASAILFSLSAFVAYADHDPFGGAEQSSVEICHVTPGNVVTNSPSISGTGNNPSIQGHQNHDDDIIPPFHYSGGEYAGKNWTAENEIIWNNGSCDGVVPVPGCTDATANNYNPDATEDDGSCTYDPVPGCTDPTANNHDPLADTDDGSCTYDPVPGCTDPTATNYNPIADTDDGSCTYDPVPGCTDPAANNYNQSATVDDGSCTYDPGPIPGCTDPTANNYSPAATVDDGSCTYDVFGCTDSTANNYNPLANVDDGSCTYDPVPVPGCTDSTANNYDQSATVDDGSCTYDQTPVPGCTDPTANNYNQSATTDDGSCTYDGGGAGTVDLYLNKHISGDNQGFALSQFSYHVTGNGVDAVVPHDNTIALEPGTYTISEVVPDGFVKLDWRIGWYGQCESGDTFSTTITIEEGDLEKEILYCEADNQYRPGDNEDVLGCTDPFATNYNASATTDNGSCEYDDGGGGNQCVPELDGGWADSVISASQGNDNNGAAITDPNRTDPDEVLDEADWTNGGSTGFYSLGFGGSIVVAFDSFVPDVDGNDISIHEATIGDGYPEESALIEVSQNGSDWFEVGTASNLDDLTTRTSYFDFASTGLTWIKYVRVTDTTNGDLHDETADGFDLDAVDATQTVCTEPDDGGGESSDRFIIEGYVWHDDNRNKDWDGFAEESPTEEELTGWTVNITNGEVNYSTTTDADGYYYFEVPAGTWTITEVLEEGWELITPVSASHVVTVPDEESLTMVEQIFAFLIPTAHAAVIDTYGPYNFGNDEDTSGGGGGGGGGRSSGGSSSGGGGSDDDDAPAGQVLGDQVTAVPLGAADLGAGGAAQHSVPATPFAAFLIGYATRLNRDEQ